MKKWRLTILVFVFTFIIVLVLSPSTKALTSEQFVLNDLKELPENTFIGYKIAFDGNFIYSFYPENTSTITVWKYNLDAEIIEGYDLGIPSSGFDSYYSGIETDGTNLYILIYNYTSTNYTFVVYNMNSRSIQKSITIDTLNVNGYLLDLEYVSGDLYTISISSNIELEKGITVNSANPNVTVYRLDPNTGKLAREDLDTSVTTKNYGLGQHFAYIGDEFIIDLYPAAIATLSGNIIANTTEQTPNLNIPQGSEIISEESVIAAMDSSPNNTDLLAVVEKYVQYNQSGNIGYASVSYLVKYTYNSSGGTSLTGGLTGEPDVTEPITASSIAVATVSATAAAGAVSTAAASTATGTAGGITASSAGGATASGTAGTSGAGGVGSSGASTTGVGTSSAELTVKSTGISGRIERYGIRIGKYALKLLKRKKKRGEGEEEKFEKPSFIKLMVYLAIISGVLTGLFFLFNKGILADLFVAGSTLVTGIGFSFGVFGLLTGYLLWKALKQGLLPPATLIGKISIFASILGGAYGFITSALKLWGAFGFISIFAWLVLCSVGFIFAYAAYVSTLRVYGRV